MDEAAVNFFAAVFFLTFSTVLFVWMYQDAKARGINPWAWLFVVVLFNVLGLVIYLYQRPRGRLVACSSCGMKRPESAWVCPHCKALTHVKE